MSTSDPFDLPPEVRGLVNQVGAGASTSPLGASPGPGALAGSSPGASPTVIAPLAAPTLPDPTDPAAMVLLIARMANEMFGGPAGAPPPVSVPSPQQAVTGAGASAPVSPGLSAGAPLGPSPAGAPGLSDAPAIPSPATTTPAAPDARSISPGLSIGSPDVPSISPPTAAPAAPDARSIAPAWSELPDELLQAAVPASLPLVAPAATEAPGAPWMPPVASPFGATSLAGFDPDAFVETVRISFVGEPAAAAPPAAAAAPAAAPFDPYAVRRDFPILDERVHGKRLVWLDNAATTQKPRAVIDRLVRFYEHESSNIHRAAHTLAARATDAYEQGREISRRFLNAPSRDEIVFVRGATEGINLVAQSWGRRNVQAGDEIVITHLEHHANIVPWQQLCAEQGARLRVAPVDDRGDVILEEYDRLLGPRTRLVAFPQVSNALGTIAPARAMIDLAHRHGAVVMVDGAQAVSHMAVDVQALDCDFYVFSGHKVYAPTGIGVVFGKRDVLAQMPPWQGGGNMIQDVTFERTTYQLPPARFEAGTGNIADAAGLGAALEYVMQIGMDVIDRHEHGLLVHATERLLAVPGLTMIGTSPNKAGVLSFVLAGHRNEDVGAALDREGIAVRSGHHCAQPILRRFGHEGTVRASLGLYNVCEDIDAMVAVLLRLAARP